MTLLELCEPLLQYMCRLNRSARKGAQYEHSQVRAEIEAEFSNVLSQAASDPLLANHLDPSKGKIAVVLTFFVDFMIKESKLPFAGEWQELAVQKYNELAGDEKFWDLLDEALADRGEQADERAAVYYTCMGLGFTGWYAGQPEFLRKKMLECSVRIRERMDVDDTAALIPDSELYPNTDDLIEPPGKSLAGIGIALVGLLFVLFVGNIYLYNRTTSDLNKSLNAIIDSKAPPASAKPPDSAAGADPNLLDTTRTTE